MFVHPEFDRLQREFGWRAESVAIADESRKLWIATSGPTEQSAFSDSQWNDLNEFLDKSWWYQTRNEIIGDALRHLSTSSTIWDLGGGSGEVAHYLRDHGHSVIEIEPSLTGATIASQRGITSLCGRLRDFHLPSESIQTFTMFDVLEHLSNRDEVLAETYRTLAPGGRLVLSVPALNALWSQFDDDAGHFRRYNKASIRNELKSQGFTVERIGYFFTLTVLPVFVLRAIPYRLGRTQSTAAREALGPEGGALGAVARRIERKIALRTPIGSSILVIATKTRNE